jgi:hypothetical protein
MAEQAQGMRKPAAPRPVQLAHALAANGRTHALEQIGRTLNAGPAVQAVQRVANRTGLPNQLKAGVEALSGIAMDDVRVHRNSSRPAQLQAHAFAQGADIHLAPGQEHHLPHEAWHVVQQKQGRVKPTLQMRARRCARWRIRSERS